MHVNNVIFIFSRKVIKSEYIDVILTFKNWVFWNKTELFCFHLYTHDLAYLALEVKLSNHTCTHFYFLLGTLSKTEWHCTFFLFQSTIQAEVPATIPALPKNVVKESVAKNDIPTGKVLQKNVKNLRENSSCCTLFKRES